MKWNVHLLANKFSTYEFMAEDGKRFICKFNLNQGSIRIEYNEHRVVLFADVHHINHRKFMLTNAYGSKIGIVTKNLWHENTGTVVFKENNKKLHFKIDSYNSLIELNSGNITDTCELSYIPHPGKEKHYIPILIALSWLQNTQASIMVESTA